MTNYFEWFQLPISYNLDQPALKRRFLERSRDLHPDHQPGLAGPELEALLDQSSLNNQAYNALLEDGSRLQHILHLYGLLDEAAGTPRQLPSNFLMEMMELNEGIDELRFEFDRARFEALDAQVRDHLSGTQAQIANYMHQFEEAPLETRAVLLEPVLTLYLERKYLLRLAEGLRTFARA